MIWQFFLVGLAIGSAAALAKTHPSFTTQATRIRWLSPPRTRAQDGGSDKDLPIRRDSPSLHKREPYILILHQPTRMVNITGSRDTISPASGKHALPKLISVRCHERCKKKKMLAKQPPLISGHLATAHRGMPKITATKPRQPRPAHAQKEGEPPKSFCKHSLRRPI